MYNSGDEITITLDNLDDDKKDELSLAKEIAMDLSSLSNAETLSTSTSDGMSLKNPLHFISEDSKEPLDAHDVQSFMGYNFFLPFAGVRVSIY